MLEEGVTMLPLAVVRPVTASPPPALSASTAAENDEPVKPHRPCPLEEEDELVKPHTPCPPADAENIPVPKPATFTSIPVGPFEAFVRSRLMPVPLPLLTTSNTSDVLVDARFSKRPATLVPG